MILTGSDDDLAAYARKLTTRAMVVRVSDAAGEHIHIMNASPTFFDASSRAPRNGGSL